MPIRRIDDDKNEYKPEEYEKMAKSATQANPVVFDLAKAARAKEKEEQKRAQYSVIGQAKAASYDDYELNYDRFRDNDSLEADMIDIIRSIYGDTGDLYDCDTDKIADATVNQYILDSDILKSYPPVIYEMWKILAYSGNLPDTQSLYDLVQAYSNQEEGPIGKKSGATSYQTRDAAIIDNDAQFNVLGNPIGKLAFDYRAIKGTSEIKLTMYPKFGLTDVPPNEQTSKAYPYERLGFDAITQFDSGQKGEGTVRISKAIPVFKRISDIKKYEKKRQSIYLTSYEEYDSISNGYAQGTQQSMRTDNSNDGIPAGYIAFAKTGTWPLLPGTDSAPVMFLNSGSYLYNEMLSRNDVNQSYILPTLTNSNDYHYGYLSGSFHMPSADFDSSGHLYGNYTNYKDKIGGTGIRLGGGVGQGLTVRTGINIYKYAISNKKLYAFISAESENMLFCGKEHQSIGGASNRTTRTSDEYWGRYRLSGWIRINEYFRGEPEDIVIEEEITGVKTYKTIVPISPVLKVPQDANLPKLDVTSNVITEANEFDTEYFENLYINGQNASKSQYLTNHSIIGLPFNFLSTTDLRYGFGAEFDDQNRTGYGSEYTQNILYDMPIAVIHPGFRKSSKPGVLQSLVDKVKGIYTALSANNSKLTNLFDEMITQWFANGDYERFYLFDSHYALYIQYTNTLCHLFAQFLGIYNTNAPTSTGGTNGSDTYGQYDDAITKIDQNNAFTNQFGLDPAVFIYYQPESNLNQTFTTSTTDAGSSIMDKIQEASGVEKQIAAFGDILGTTFIDSLKKGVEDVTKSIGDLLGSTLGGVLIKGTDLILSGNNISLPDIWQDSNTEVTHDIKVKLVSPYGDPESIFLYVLRPLARLLALALPHQASANSYSEPFLIQAFSKGQFSCQLGYITSMSITRGGEGGESHTINHIPTELDVEFTITDLYEKIMLSNEYGSGNDAGSETGEGFILGSLFSGLRNSLGNFRKSIGLMLNNLGLLDFVASYSGYNLNAPSQSIKLEMILGILKNRVDNTIKFDENGMNLPEFEKSLIDSYHDVVSRAQTFVNS